MALCGSCRGEGEESYTSFVGARKEVQGLAKCESQSLSSEKNTQEESMHRNPPVCRRPSKQGEEVDDRKFCWGPAEVIKEAPISLRTRAEPYREGMLHLPQPQKSRGEEQYCGLTLHPSWEKAESSKQRVPILVSSLLLHVCYVTHTCAHTL